MKSTKKEVCMGGVRQESGGESNKMVKWQVIVQAKQVPFKIMKPQPN